MKDILEMTKADLLALDPGCVTGMLSIKEVVHIAETLDAFWRYDYDAAESGRPGKHALLKSGLHSDGFLVSKILLEPDNIRLLMAHQMFWHFNRLNIVRPDYLVGIPDGATKLAEDLGGIMGVETAFLRKIDGRITVMAPFFTGSKLLIVEDFCTKGTGFKETVAEIKNKNPEVEILPYEMVIVNRGGLKEIVVDGAGAFAIIPIADYPIKEWDPDPKNCELCRKYGSVAVKPKVSEESWRDITTSQLSAENRKVEEFLNGMFP